MLNCSFVYPGWASVGQGSGKAPSSFRTKRSGKASLFSLRLNLEQRDSEPALRPQGRGKTAEHFLVEQVLELRQQLEALRAENEKLRSRSQNAHLFQDEEASDLSADGRTLSGKHGERSRFLPVYAVAPEEVLSRIIPVVGPNPTMEQLDAAISLSFQVRDSLVAGRGYERYEDAMAGRFLVFQTSSVNVEGVQRVALPGTVTPMRWASAPVGILMPASELGLDAFFSNVSTDVNCLVIIEADFDAEIPSDTLAAPEIIRNVRDRNEEVLDKIENVWFDELGRPSRDAVSTDTIEEQVEEGEETLDSNDTASDDTSGPEFIPGKFYLWLEEEPAGDAAAQEPARKWLVRWYERRPDPQVDGVECVGRVIAVVAPSTSRRRSKVFAEEDELF